MVLIALYYLWFQSDDIDYSAIELNFKLLICALRFFTFVKCFFKFEHYGKNQIMLMVSNVGNFIILIFPSSNFETMAPQIICILSCLIDMIGASLYYVLHGEHVPGDAEHKANMLGN